MLGSTSALRPAAGLGGPDRVAVRVAPWRALAAAALVSLALGAALGGMLTARHARPTAAAQLVGAKHGGISVLPLPAQAMISGTLGADRLAYRIRRSAGGLRAVSPAQGLSVSFGSSGMTLRSGALQLGLSLRASGYGQATTRLGEVVPGVKGNRVRYAHAGMSEWYANGPLGLEQGFTVTRAPSARQAGPLILSMALSTNARAVLAPDRQSVALTGRGGPSLRYGGLLATDAGGRTLPSWLELHGHNLSLHVAASGARYPLRIDPLIQQAELTGGEESGGGRFGFSVALSSDGNTALVGGQEDNGSVGAAWVFTRSGSTWTQQGPKLTGSGETAAGRFGVAVALSSDGNTALIGGVRDNSGSGAAWVFTRSGSIWTQQGPKLTAGEEVGEGELGTAVALSADGNTALVGGSGDSGNTGAAWVFTRSGSTWTQQGPKLIGSGEIGGNNFGDGVALSSEGNTALIGAPFDGTGGAAWVFTRSGSTWTQQGPKLTGTGEIGEGAFGFAVALSSDGNTALIGGHLDNKQPTQHGVGAAWVFTRSGSTWTQQGPKLTGGGEVGTGDFGESVAISSAGNSALIGGSNDNSEIGAAWVFTRSGSTWTQQGSKLKASGEIGTGTFGLSVALSATANTALIGGPGDNRPVESGAAWAFVNPPPTVTKVEPNHGPLAGGTKVTITGTHFTGATAVKFGSNNAAKFKVNSATSITAVSPKGTGTVDVTVTTAAGTSATSAADQFTYKRN